MMGAGVKQQHQRKHRKGGSACLLIHQEAAPCGVRAFEESCLITFKVLGSKTSGPGFHGLDRPGVWLAFCSAFLSQPGWEDAETDPNGLGQGKRDRLGLQCGRERGLRRLRWLRCPFSLPFS